MTKVQFLFFIFFSIVFEVASQSIVINEFSSVNNDVLDEDNESPDWFELYNTSTEPFDLLNFAISDDSTDLRKWTFPSLNLHPKEVMLVFASGKDRSELTFYSSLINQGDTFSYIIGSSEVPTDWKNIGFNDSAWSKGPSGFGFGDDDDATLISNGTLSVFVRKRFQLSDLNEIKELLFHVDYDDGFVAYINGKEIARSNLGTVNGNVPYNQTADINQEAIMYTGMSPQLFALQNFADIIVEGENVLSIQVHNYSNGSSDLTLIPFLSAGYKNPFGDNPVPEILNLKDKKSLHTNFKISADGEKLFLSDPQGVIIDQTDSIPLPMGVSYGRHSANIDKWVYFAEPTPGALNETQSYDSIGNRAITFSPSGGKYSSAMQISLSSTPGSSIFYTTDGSDPKADSNKYTSPITITKTTVIRAIVANADIISLTPAFETYVIENRDFDLPIISLSTDPYNLFDFNYGIYEMGPNASTSNPYFGANFWQDWERPINIEYFDDHGEKQFSATGGTQIFGAWSRANDQKSMALFARSEYGSKSFNYPFFKERDNDKYKSLVLRNSGNDWSSTVMRDAMMTGLVRNVDIDRQAYQPVVVFLNGDYWGILNLREKVNEDFLADNHPGVDADKVDILQNSAADIEGSPDHYRHMISYIESNNMDDDNVYDSVCNMMDVVNFMDYEIAQIYFDNEDWPGNNIKFWRPQTSTGKWRWILYDTDFGFDIGYGTLQDGFKNNTLAFAMAPNGPSWPNPPWSTFLLRSMLENDKFRREFINRFADRLNQEFKPVTVNKFIDSLKTNIEDEIPYHIERWQHIWDWEGNVNHLKTFGTNRQKFVREHINNEFALGGIVNLTVNVSNSKHGVVQVNSLLLNDYPWAGKYFMNNKVPINAIAKPGYEFSHWEGNESTSPYLILSIPSSGADLKAVFKVSEKEYNSIVINEINYNSSPDFDCGDWIELYNTTYANLDLSGYILKDGNGGDIYKLPKGTLIAGKNYLVLSRESGNFTKVYPGVYNVVGGLDFGLSSTYDILRLYDKANSLIDSVTYFNDYPWPVITDNQTISLYTPYSDNTIGTNWKSSVGNGTPGWDNDYYIFIPERTIAEAIVEASCFPNPTRGSATIRWTCNSTQTVQINLFNVGGQLVNVVFNNTCSVGTFEESIFDEGEYQKGIYFAQIKFANGDSKTLKLVKM